MGLQESQENHNSDEDLPGWIFEEESSDKEVSPISSFSFSSSSPTSSITPSLVVKRIYSLGRILAQVFQDFKVDYWTSGGTTLGLIRHGGLIPWDDDIDLCITLQEESYFTQQIFPHLRLNYGYEYEQTFFGYRIFHSEDSMSLDNPLFHHRYPFADIMLMVKETNKYVLYHRAARALWPQEYYYTKQVIQEKLLIGTYGDFTFPYPRDSQHYLNRTYGPNWNHVGETQNYSHTTKSTIQPIQFQLKQFEPARPFS